MSETLFDNTTVPSGGGSVTAEFGSDKGKRNVVKVIGDSNATDLDVTVSGVDIQRDLDDTRPLAAPQRSIGQTGVDASGDVMVLLPEMVPYERGELKIVNNAASNTTITVKSDSYGSAIGG